MQSKSVGLIVVVVLIVGAVFYFSRASDSQPSDTALSDSSRDVALNTDSPNVLSGNGKSTYREFSQAEYEKALSEKKIVLLYFYASWCPICRAEQEAVIEAFTELENEEVIGFRVNYKDSSTDSDEEKLAKDFGVTYQHTKVILKDGSQALKSLDSWDKDRYGEELRKLV